MDVFADIDFEANDVRPDQFAKETKTFLRLVEKLSPLVSDWSGKRLAFVVVVVVVVLNAIVSCRLFHSV